MRRAVSNQKSSRRTRPQAHLTKCSLNSNPDAIPKASKDQFIPPSLHWKEGIKSQVRGTSLNGYLQTSLQLRLIQQTRSNPD